ncbi:MAG TPA: PspA/IM30 family protein [Jatrophihabitantaceae bacterium]|jgi:phage shock protein A
MAKPNPFVRGWKYMSAWFGAKIDEKADPKIQIQQAISEAQQQHQALTRQAASVIGNQRQLEMKLDRQLGQIETLQAQARQALVLADKARAGGDAQKATEFEQTAQSLANQLVSVEASVQDLKSLHDQSLQAAAQAREAVKSNEMRLEQQLAERTKLLTQLEQAKMQETVSKSLQQMSELAAPSNTPSLGEVRDKIEQRYSVALGQAELAQDSVAGRTLEVQRATIDLQGSARLEEIRASMNAEKGPAAVEGGAAPAIGSAQPSTSAIPDDAAKAPDQA